jgi:hypothetical protein
MLFQDLDLFRSGCVLAIVLGRVLTHQETFPLKDGTVMNGIASFVPETNQPDESQHTLVPYLLHQDRLSPVEV